MQAHIKLLHGHQGCEESTPAAPPQAFPRRQPAGWSLLMRCQSLPDPAGPLSEQPPAHPSPCTVTGSKLSGSMLTFAMTVHIVMQHIAVDIKIVLQLEQHVVTACVGRSSM
jgi:hypothetical protein